MYRLFWHIYGWAFTTAEVEAATALEFKTDLQEKCSSRYSTEDLIHYYAMKVPKGHAAA